MTVEAEGPVSRPSGRFKQPVWTGLALLVLTGLVLTALTVVVLAIATVGNGRDRRVWRELDTAGVRVLGTVTSAERVRCGEDERCTKVQMLVTVPGRTPFTTSHLVSGEKVVEVGASIAVDVHPARNLFRLVDE